MGCLHFVIFLLHFMQVIESLYYFGVHVALLPWLSFMIFPLDILWLVTPLSVCPLHFAVR